MLQELKRIPQEQGMQLHWRVIKVHAPNPEFDVPYYNKKIQKEYFEWIKLQRICANKKDVSPDALEEDCSH